MIKTVKTTSILVCSLFTFSALATVDTSFYLNEANGLVSNDTTRLLMASDGSLYIGTFHGLSRFKDGAIKNSFTNANGRYLEIVTALGEGAATGANIASEILVGKGRSAGSDGAIGYGFEKLMWNTSGSFGWGDKSEPVYMRYADRWISFVSVNASQEVEVLAINNSTGSGRRNVGEASISTDPNFLGASDFLSGESLYAILDWNGQRLLGGDDGLFVRDNTTGATIHLDGSTWKGKGGFLFATSNRSVRAIAKDGLGNIWIGLQAGSYEAGGLVQYQPANDLLNGTWSSVIALPGGNDVRRLVVDGSNNLWIATNNGLKCRLAKDGSIQYIGTADGLPSADIRDVAYDAATKYLYVATAAGVARILTP